jgi:hypothetical protein
MSLQKLKETANRITKHLEAVENKGEEATKQALVLPIIAALGYDIWHPSEVCPEYEADFAIKKAGQKEKVDYAILIDNVPRIYIEVKKYKTNLLNHQGQLARYFNSTPTVSLAILTNGVEYWLYTDTVMSNIMDTEPFYIVNLESYESGLEGLATFHKTQFSESTARNLAINLSYIKKLTSFLREQLDISNNNPSDTLIRWVLTNGDIFGGRLTTNTIDRFRPLIKQALYQVLQEILPRLATKAGQQTNLPPIHFDNGAAALTELTHPINLPKPASPTSPLVSAAPTAVLTTSTAPLETPEIGQSNGELPEVLTLDLEPMEEITSTTNLPAPPAAITVSNEINEINEIPANDDSLSENPHPQMPPLEFEIINQQFTASPLVKSKLFDAYTQQELAVQLNWEQTPAYYSIYIYSPSWWIARFPLDEPLSWVGFNVDLTSVKTTIPKTYEILAENNYARLRIKIATQEDLNQLNKLILTACQRIITSLRKSLKQAGSDPVA